MKTNFKLVALGFKKSSGWFWGVAGATGTIADILQPIAHAAYVKKEFEVTFDKAGFYDYYCELHQAVMRGVVIVRPAAGGD